MNGMQLLKLLRLSCAKRIDSSMVIILLLRYPINAGVGDHFGSKENHVIPALIERFHQAKM